MPDAKPASREDIVALQQGLESLYDIIGNLATTVQGTSLQVQTLTTIALRTDHRMLRLERRLTEIDDKLARGFKLNGHGET